ncbi:putative tetratricopeptide-like helical domain superfamily [Helianthus annuus]|uniref:Putative tetratricopeptide repeat (TPR)-like superfamily protein n=1 Tax=Helianthus annuus TaxID=4232 RepID=A0A251UB54_HELAN|nr:putative pentatricopeptide repeat-containing protein At3g47840 [Helianthus annuus]KAF5798641.1 putative tetratricopeptide-like helical domain superfamily [Helianthus annuus]KAJ0550210.1 putative tetratricopeptide-like helical domain superfamily [Helianthus annuus]KAJ0556854.1 putative tetratricopeptide-like helical domain superfamily [Helianthus annuus]KAJ0563165.1 putative tetratricopeptide-like helical domain superfamily [Helianthus annuus]KAJ0728533.1 putative tetratricopeptide-like heli
MLISARIYIRRSYTTTCVAYAHTIKTPSIQEPHNVNMFQVNTELKELVKSGKLNGARQVFDKMPQRDEVTWTTIISGYVKAADPSEALSLFSTMWVDPSQRMDPFLLSLALKACAISFGAKQGESLHGYCVKTDFVSSVFVGSALLDMYMKIGKVYEGCRVFDEMPIRNVVSWTAVITGLVRAGLNMEGIAYFSKLCRNNMAYDSYTLAIALKACADACLLRTGKEIHAQTLKKGFDTTSFVANTLTTMYNKCGKAEYALYLFETIKTKDVVSWTTIITSYVQTGQDHKAVNAFLRMRESEVIPNEYTLAAVISGCANTAQIDLGQQFHAHVLHNGLMSCMSVANSVMTMYSKCGKLHLSSIVFHEMTQKDIISWSTIIGGHAQGGFGEEAFRYLSLMKKDGPKPNEFAFSSVLSVCGNMAILEQGKQLHAHCICVGLDHTAMVRSGLINMYSKCGSINESLKIFNEAEHNDIVSWTAMINGYAEHGLSQQAIDLFERLVKVGLRPDAITFIGVLTACSHAGLVDLGFHYFNQITNYKLSLSKEHYGCMIDLLCRAGRLREAENMITDMPYNVDDVVWSTLLRACRLHGDVDLGAHAAKRILEMDPNCASTHIMLANLYSVKGKWREAAEMRRLMRRKGVIKEPGWSWIKIRDCVFAFAAGDRSNPQWEDICCVLGLLSSKEQVFVNVENVLVYNIDEVEEKFWQ